MSSISIDWGSASTELETIYFSVKSKVDSLNIINENALFLSIL